MKIRPAHDANLPLANRPGIHIALGGGSARGLAHLGILKGLQDHQIPIASIAGTSMGALVGASFALLANADLVIQHFQEHVQSEQFNKARYAFLKEVTRRNREDRGFNFGLGLKRGFLISRTYTKGSIISFEEYVREVNALIPDKTFKGTKLPFYVTSVDLLQSKEVVFNEGYLRSAVMASAAIPGLFPAVCQGEIIYIDGGWMNKIPVSPLQNLGAKKILAIQVSDTEAPQLNPRRGTHLMRMADIASQKRLEELQIQDANLLWDPNLNDLDLMDFDQVDRAVEVGYEFAVKHIDQAKALCEPDKPPTIRERLCNMLCPCPVPKIAQGPGFEWRGIWEVGPMEIFAN